MYILRKRAWKFKNVTLLDFRTVFRKCNFRIGLVWVSRFWKLEMSVMYVFMVYFS